jgi:hypothetical protein
MKVFGICLVFCALVAVLCDEVPSTRSCRECERKVKFSLSQEEVEKASEWFDEVTLQFEATDGPSVTSLLKEGSYFMRFNYNYAQNAFVLAAMNAKYEAIDSLFEMGFRMDFGTLRSVFLLLIADDSREAFEILKTIHLHEHCTLVDITVAMHGLHFELALKSSDPDKAKFLMELRSPLDAAEVENVAMNLYNANAFESILKFLKTSSSITRSIIIRHLCKTVIEDTKLEYIDLFFQFNMNPIVVKFADRERIYNIAREFGHENIIKKFEPLLRK